MQPYLSATIAVFFLLFRVRLWRCPSLTLLCSVLCFSHFDKPSSLQAHWGRCCHYCFLAPVYLFTYCVKECLSPILWWSVLMLWLLLQTISSPSTLRGEVLPLLLSPASLFIHSSSGDCLSPPLWSSGCPALFAKHLFFSATF
jgi:hypothetical protein